MNNARRAGHETAVADFKSGKFNMPLKSDRRDWANGYRAAVLDLAATFGKDAVNVALPEGVRIR